MYINMCMYILETSHVCRVTNLPGYFELLVSSHTNSYVLQYDSFVVELLRVTT